MAGRAGGGRKRRIGWTGLRAIRPPSGGRDRKAGGRAGKRAGRRAGLGRAGATRAASWDSGGTAALGQTTAEQMDPNPVPFLFHIGAVPRAEDSPRSQPQRPIDSRVRRRLVRPGPRVLRRRLPQHREARPPHRGALVGGCPHHPAQPGHSRPESRQKAPHLHIRARRTAAADECRCLQGRRPPSSRGPCRNITRPSKVPWPSWPPLVENNSADIVKDKAGLRHERDEFLKSLKRAEKKRRERSR